MVAMAAAMLPVRIITDPITEGVILGPSPWRWAIDLITFTEVVITKAAPITSGNQAIGQRGTGSESGSTAITWCEDIRPVNQGAAASKPPWATGDRPSLNHFKRSAASIPSVPNENGQLLPGNLIRSARFYEN